ncbi:MAG: SMC family ATPase [Chloroflexi bacterium]|nr:SMC family ATPase [Chloroflexota bacterium]
MIPAKLTLRNFLCYRENVPPLSFEGLHLVCLSGDNGNGKSALIDAMTWALWGEARDRRVRDDDLVYQGQPEMEVDFEFHAGGDLYRVIRKHARPKRSGGAPQSLLELQVAAPEGFRSVSGNTIAETEDKIINILRMDYDTFINSAYLRQGNADEFTRQPPARRKEVFTSILGLELYDRLEGQAKELAKSKEISRAQIETLIKQISGELELKPGFEGELQQGTHELESLAARVKEKDTELARLRREKDALEARRASLSQVEERKTAAARDLQFWNSQVKLHGDRVREYEALLADRGRIEAGYACLLAARKLKEELDRKLKVFAGLNERRHSLEMAVARAGQALNQEHALARSRIAEIEAKAARLPALKGKLQETHLQLAGLDAQEKALQKERQASQELQSRISALKLGQARLAADIAGIDEKLDLLAATAEARCPLCERELEPGNLDMIRSKYVEERRERQDSVKAGDRELADSAERLAALSREVSRLESRLAREKAALQTRAGTLAKEVEDCQEAAARREPETENLAGIEDMLASRQYALNEQRALEALDAELFRLAYHPEKHEEAREALSGVEGFETSRNRLDEAARLIGDERSAGLKAGEAAQRLQAAIEDADRQIRELGQELGRLPDVISGFSQVEAEYRTLTEQRDQVQERLGAVKARLQRCVELERDRTDKTKQAAQLSREEWVYRELAKAFGKSGVQALLIELALPEIENEANGLLSRMTDNRMHIKFETQRETRKGDIAETLDIHITDELGTRSYETFSGGEAFRINFAIRIALSRLLARRAGSPLRTLIIDEGFGTQDSTGIEKLKEAINSIQDDFSRIIVITHIEDLRDAVPARIEVVKTADGSTLAVN